MVRVHATFIVQVAQHDMHDGLRAQARTWWTGLWPRQVAGIGSSVLGAVEQIANRVEVAVVGAVGMPVVSCTFRMGNQPCK